IATEAAFFSIPEVRVGMPPLGVMPFLIRAIGHRSFRRYGFSGERIAPAEALRIGLVHQVCDAASVEETVTRIADELLHGAPRAARRDGTPQGGRGAVCLAAALRHPGPSRAARSEVAGGGRRRRCVPREAQTRLVSEIEHDPEKCAAVFGKDHAQTIETRPCA